MSKYKMKVIVGILFTIGVICLVIAEEHDELYEPFQGSRNDSFDWQLSRVAFQAKKGNVVLSPFSAKTILLLLAESSEIGSNTKKQLDMVLADINLPYGGRDVYKSILHALASSGGVTMKTGTKLFLQKGLEPRSRYKSNLKHFYETTIENVDFTQTDTITKVINNWVADITNNNIQNLVNGGELADSILVMLNAVYFKGSWRRPFKPEKTVTETFNTPDKPIQTEFITDTDNYYFFESKDLNAKILRLPYADSKFSMFFILPDGNLDDLVKNLNSTTVNREAWYLDEVEVRVKIPKFHFNTDVKMKPLLQSLGIVDIFTDDASFPLIISPETEKKANLKLKVSNIKQKAGIKVDEYGSEAYAATMGQFVNKMGGAPPQFFATKPFIFFIENEATGTVLFIGKVEDPSMAE